MNHVCCVTGRIWIVKPDIYQYIFTSPGKDGQTSDGPHAVILTKPGLTRRKAQKNLSPVAKMWKKPPGRRVRSQYCHSGPPAGLDHLRGTDIMQ